MANVVLLLISFFVLQSAFAEQVDFVVAFQRTTTLTRIAEISTELRELGFAEMRRESAGQYIVRVDPIHAQQVANLPGVFSLVGSGAYTRAIVSEVHSAEFKPTPCAVHVTAAPEIKVVETKPLVAIAPSPVPDETLFAALRAARERLISERESVYRGSYISIGRELPFNGRKFKIKAFYGKGDEGFVYEVVDVADSSQVTRVMKRFYNQWDLKENLRLFALFRSKGIRTPDIIEVDLENRSILMEKIDGFPLGAMFEYGARYGLNQKHMNAVWERFKPLNQRGEYGSFWRLNVVIDVNTGDFVLIDPQ